MAEPDAETQTGRQGMIERLLVVTIDRLPAWILPAYGATWVSMPALDALAGRGVVFDGLVATGTDPRRTIADLLGGPAAPVAAVLGGPAAVVTDDAALTDVVAGAAVRVVEARAATRPAADEDDTNIARLFAAATEVVAAGRHRFVWCHASSLGAAWDAPDEFRDAYLDPDDPPPPAGAAVPDLVVTADTDPDLVVGLRHVFAGQLTLLDRRLARLLAAAEAGWTIVVVGVRGMPLGLHGRIGTGPMPPYGELVRLPAIVVDGGGRMAAQRFGGLVTPADLGATLRALAIDVAPPADAFAERGAGRSLARLFESWSAVGRDRVVTVTPEGVAVRTPAWQLVLPATAAEGEVRPRLFAMPDDFFEVCDVADRCSDVADELGQLADAARRGDTERAWTAALTPAAAGTD
jgi:arylsulfatase A-like enzyme